MTDDPRPTGEQEYASGKRGHSAEVLARKLGATRNAYRQLQAAHIAAKVTIQKYARRGAEEFNRHQQAHSDWINEKNRLEYRVEIKENQLAECHKALRYRWLLALRWFVIGLAVRDLLMRIFA